MFFHLVPYRKNRFGATFYLERKSCLLELLFDRFDDARNVFVACCFGLVELVCNFRILLSVSILKRHIFEFRFNLVQAQTVSQRSIEIHYLRRNVEHEFLVVVMVNHLHQTETVDNHNDDNADVFGKSHHQFAEVFILKRALLFVENGNLKQTFDDIKNVFAKLRFYSVGGNIFGFAKLIQQNRYYHILVGAEILRNQFCGVKVPYNWINAIFVAFGKSFLNSLIHNVTKTNENIIGNLILKCFH